MKRRLTIDASSIAGQMEETPEGFLIFLEVPLARTGEQIYYSHELPGIPAVNGKIIAQRDPDQVFAEAAVKSFRGNPFTDDHPFEDVDPTNFKKYLAGTIMNPRRGTGAYLHCVVGDLIVYDQSTIAKIRAGKRELSCGYDAEYEVIEPGRARQINIRGNHVSLVDEGRCGPTCAIRDKGKHMAAIAASRPSWFDRLTKAVRAKDEAEREEHLAAAEAEMPDGGVASDGDGHHIVLNIGAPGADTKPKDAVSGEKDGAAEEGKDMDEDRVNEIVGAAIEKALTPVAASLAAITSKIEEMSSSTAATAEKVDAVAEAMEDMTDPDDMATQDAVARAEILAPGLQLPVRDARPGSKAHRDAMGNFQRAALKQALTTDTGRVVVGAVLGHVQPHRIAAMPANEAAVAFRAASQIMLDQNAAQVATTLQSATTGYMRDDTGKRVRPMNTADLAQIHRDHYAQRRA